MRLCSVDCKFVVVRDVGSVVKEKNGKQPSTSSIKNDRITFHMPNIKFIYTKISYIKFNYKKFNYIASALKFRVLGFSFRV